MKKIFTAADAHARSVTLLINAMNKGERKNIFLFESALNRHPKYAPPINKIKKYIIATHLAKREPYQKKLILRGGFFLN